MSELLFVSKSAEKRYTLGVVYEPDVLDSQSEFAKSDDIEQAAWSFMSRLQQVAKSSAVILSELQKMDAQGEVELSVDLDALDDILEKHCLDDEHLQCGDVEDLGVVVESYIAPVDFNLEGQEIKKGSWLLGVVWSDSMWQKVKKGERTGLSMFGRAERVRA